MAITKKSEPKMTKSEPKMTKSEPKMTKSEPKMTKNIRLNKFDSSDTYIKCTAVMSVYNIDKNSLSVSNGKRIETLKITLRSTAGYCFLDAIDKKETDLVNNLKINDVIEIKCDLYYVFRKNKNTQTTSNVLNLINIKSLKIIGTLNARTAKKSDDILIAKAVTSIKNNKKVETKKKINIK
ncbi:hypothetical protein [Spiroplasma endosymbiont of Labia minor]|uniref:hypothetical protein n=1 Tax=Spiroplasma endosymbiont of Labia minor TaxID=3066305 RepID=UPI0030D37B4B